MGLDTLKAVGQPRRFLALGQLFAALGASQAALGAVLVVDLAPK